MRRAVSERHHLTGLSGHTDGGSSYIFKRDHLHMDKGILWQRTKETADSFGLYRPRSTSQYARIAVMITPHPPDPVGIWTELLALGRREEYQRYPGYRYAWVHTETRQISLSVPAHIF